MAARSWLSTLLGILLTTLAATLLVAPAHAASEDLSVRVDSISPVLQDTDGTVRLTGTVTNSSDEPWRDVHAYLVVPTWPLTSRSQLDAVLAAPDTTIGERIVDAGRFATIGELPARASRTFALTVPTADLRLPSTAGILPVGVHIMATDSDGHRPATALARTTTVLPRLGTNPTAVPTTVIWPFLPTWSVTDADPAVIAASVATGQLRRYLTAAAATPRTARTLVVEPSLLDELTAIAADPRSAGISTELAGEVTAWIDELLTLAHGSDTWIADYGRPDLVALNRPDTPDRALVLVDDATRDAMERYALSGPRLAWPARPDTTSGLVTSSAARATDLMIVDHARVPRWSAPDGSVVTSSPKTGAQTLLVLDASATAPARATAADVGQRILSRTAMASIERDSDSDAVSDGVFFIDPKWDPGATGGATLAAVLDPTGLGTPVQPATLTDVTRARPGALTGAVRTTTDTTGISAGLVDAALRHHDLVDLVAAVSTDTTEQTEGLSHTVEALSLRWRHHSGAGLDQIGSRTADLARFLAGLEIDAPHTITLSGHTGVFPVTVRNDTDRQTRLRVRVTADRPGVTFSPIEEFTVEPGDSHTVSVEATLDNQVSTTVTAQLATSEGVTFGDSEAFLVRSSRVGMLVWVGMGLAVALVIATWARRFIGRSPKSTGTVDE